MAAVIKSGTRYCGLNFYGAADTDWNLMGNSGVRTWATTITFSSAFTSTPSVNPFIIGFHIVGGATHKLGVGVASVTTTSFQLQINTWDDTQIAGVAVGYVAYVN